MLQPLQTTVGVPENIHHFSLTMVLQVWLSRNLVVAARTSLSLAQNDVDEVLSRRYYLHRLEIVGRHRAEKLGEIVGGFYDNSLVSWVLYI